MNHMLQKAWDCCKAKASSFPEAGAEVIGRVDDDNRISQENLQA